MRDCWVEIPRAYEEGMVIPRAYEVEAWMRDCAAICV